MTQNYVDVLDQLRSFGLILDSLDTSGRMKRCKVEGDREHRGWYVLHEIRTDDGTDLIVGSYGIWRGNDAGTQKVKLTKAALTSEQRDAIRQRQRQDRHRAERERQEAATRAADRAREAWLKMVEQGSSQYLARKGVSGHGVRYSPTTGALVIPMLDVGGHIHGLQIIRDQPARDQRDKEYWPRGLSKQGHFHLMGGVPSSVLLLAEGYATAASLFEATGYPTAVAFDAGNLLPVATALHKKYPYAHILICADDDRFQKCRCCNSPVDLVSDPTDCPTCGSPHKATNAGVAAASAAALAAHGAWLAPRFSDEEKLRQDYIERGRKLTDFNDLHVREGLQAVRARVESHLTELQWNVPSSHNASPATEGAGVRSLTPIDSLPELLERYAVIYGAGGYAFDFRDRMIVKLGDVRDACLNSQTYKWWMERPDRRLVYQNQIGFDPTDQDPNIVCNLWHGWPTEPKPGYCANLLNLLRYLCSADENADELADWLLKWIAYPLQHPGAKMKTTVVMHGPQGTGKNLLWETVMAIYGSYGNVIGQDALEDKFNDWASKKLFMVADEIVARQDLYHVKNKLKTMITGDQIRINPKGSMSYVERNHVNFVFLSNETVPTVLEEDDRRHCVIWTPPRLDPSYYQGVLDNIANGGVAHLHDYLLSIDLEDFGPGTLPPKSEAKGKLIDQSMDSTARFGHAFMEGEFGRLRKRPCLAQDMYNLYRSYCRAQGLREMPQPRLLNVLDRRFGSRPARKRWQADYEVRQSSVLMWDFSPPEGSDERTWLGSEITAFSNSVKDYLGTHNG